MTLLLSVDKTFIFKGKPNANKTNQTDRFWFNLFLFALICPNRKVLIIALNFLVKLIFS